MTPKPRLSVVRCPAAAPATPALMAILILDRWRVEAGNLLKDFAEDCPATEALQAGVIGVNRACEEIIRILSERSPS